jgi:hypothetical protein
LSRKNVDNALNRMRSTTVMEIDVAGAGHDHEFFGPAGQT